jgi:hypothetical protein
MARGLQEDVTRRKFDELEEIGATDNLETIARAKWSCLIEAFGTGAAGVGGEVGAELLTQHGLSQAQRLQQDAESAWPPAFTGSTGGVTASNRLNKMANVAFNQSILLFGLGLGLINFLDVFGRVFLEIFQATFAAKLNFAALVLEDVGFAHLAQFLIGNNAFIERIRFGFLVLVGSK